MGVKWTKDQEKVIQLRACNILVSAAAGSGKTAVLVERIMAKITDKAHKQDIDKILVVTFTRAAAAEMKDRISQAIQNRLKEEPDNEHLKKQEILIHTAPIMTIDGFCTYLLRNHFEQIGLDPAFRIAEEGEIKLLRGDVLGKLLEDRYARKDEDFLDFAECYAPGKSDAMVEAAVEKLYLYSMSHPYPEKWLADCYSRNEEDMQDYPWMKYLWNYIQTLLKDIYEHVLEAITLCEGPGGPVPYISALDSDKEFLDKCLQAENYSELYQVFSLKNYEALSRKKPEYPPDEQIKERVKSIRNTVKKALDGLEKAYFATSPENMFQISRQAQKHVETLCKLTIDFSRMLKEAKQKRAVVDFSDIEHYALDILLTTDEQGNLVPTPTARAYAQYYDEIMIDEYQDSNMVQELILNAISKEKNQCGFPDIFMVGDVKQSIYRFRQARPELFLEKYKTYSIEEGSSQRVDLSCNFRSREEIIHIVNYIFEKIMTEKLGNIIYDEKAALYLGADMPLPPQEDTFIPEVLIGDMGEEKLDPIEFEAMIVADKVRKYMDNGWVLDKETGEYRKPVYSDMVILLRTMSGWSDTFARVLSSYGIPNQTGTSTGYFSAQEVQCILNMLSVLNNERQDIPLCGVLRSPIGGLDEKDMAQIRVEFPEESFYIAARNYGLTGKQDALQKKLRRFYVLCDELRNHAQVVPIHELIWEIYDKTGYEQIVALQDNGSVRRENLQMLVQKALEYESTSYRGLFHFVRYIENLQKYNVDYGTAQAGMGNENTVQIMSIHKSKGLEFPVVFVSGLSKKFNKQDAKAKLIMEQDFGVAMDYLDSKKRIKMPTLNKKVFQKKIEIDGLGEEIRVLYVALTRAKEKLFLTGLQKDMDKYMDMYHGQGFYEEITGSSYLDWILGYLIMPDAPSKLQIVRPETLAAGEVIKQVKREAVIEKMEMEIQHQKLREDIKEKFAYHYPYEAELSIPKKVTVSEAKRLNQPEKEGIDMYTEEQVVPLIPDFMKEERKLSYADRGTAYHKVLQFVPVTYMKDEKQIKAKIDELVKNGQMSSMEANVIRGKDFMAFSKTDVARRMEMAKENNTLYLEQPFVIARSAKMLYPDIDSESEILIQGIIDAFFEEEDGYVLIDYKTDHINSPEELIEKYHIQLEIYENAIEGRGDKKVKEKYIYSFHLAKLIRL